MRLPVIQGVIRRRLLVNFRVTPKVIAPLLPPGFSPKINAGYAIAGICLIRLEKIRPAWAPAFIGVASENAAHRIAVHWTDSQGRACEGVYIPRRDTGSRLSHWAGGRIFPGEHHLAAFDIKESDRRIEMEIAARDGGMRVKLLARQASALPTGSCFKSLEDSSRFFEGGSVGYSVTQEPGRLDGVRLSVKKWEVTPLEVEQVESSFFADTKTFPPGTAEFDHALLMRDVLHEWHGEPDFVTEKTLT
jgi:uncharacterized protein YqjF (DUF2071 family)